jgi:predicted TIM-barrel fold metal-dependent hydrolase
LFGAPPSIAVALDFFGHDRILFASDSPVDSERGPGYIRTTIADLESLDLGEEQFGQIFAGNAQRLLRLDSSGANVS